MALIDAMDELAEVPYEEECKRLIMEKVEGSKNVEYAPDLSNVGANLQHVNVAQEMPCNTSEEKFSKARYRASSAKARYKARMCSVVSQVVNSGTSRAILTPTCMLHPNERPHTRPATADATQSAKERLLSSLMDGWFAWINTDKPPSSRVWHPKSHYPLARTDRRFTNPYREPPKELPSDVRR
ncbi:hypothetical protein HAX54_031261 [Datura stramonium]|uniref:Uncharacterized protein n=1 Tax=Datura stramonium TaxID=4076 RepID=A0ABS8VBF4_DATST|nr:hypothetical protein [Datura stramonium]